MLDVRCYGGVILGILIPGSLRESIIYTRDFRGVLSDTSVVSGLD